MFDWPRFLSTHNIEYHTSGPNVSKGNLSVHCPFCGVEDDSQHMSISLKGKGWRCWRRPDLHRGKSAVKLVQALLHCTWDQACRVVGVKQHYVPEDFMAQVKQFMEPQKSVPNGEKLQLLPQFRELNPTLYSCKPFHRYLQGRYFPDSVLRQDLRYCSTGAFKGRLIFPVYDTRKHLVTWTGRTIYPSVGLRYKTLSWDREKAKAEGLPAALGPINHYLLYQQELLHNKKFHTICICEGPMDALKVRVLGNPCGITATALFTVLATDKQIELLHSILPLFERRLIMLDAGTLPAALKLQNTLGSLGTEVITVPARLKDPGRLRSREDLLALVDMK